MKRFDVPIIGAGIPKEIQAGIDRFVAEGKADSPLILAIVSNDLIAAAGNGDDSDMKSLPVILRYCSNNIPADCWGTRERVKNWMVWHEMKKEHPSVTLQDIEREVKKHQEYEMKALAEALQLSCLVLDEIAKASPSNKVVTMLLKKSIFALEGKPWDSLSIQIDRNTSPETAPGG